MLAHLKIPNIFCNIYLIWSSYMSSVISSCFISWCVAIAGKEASTRICNGCPGAYNELSGIGSQWPNIWKYMENVQQGFFYIPQIRKTPNNVCWQRIRRKDPSLPINVVFSAYSSSVRYPHLTPESPKAFSAKCLLQTLATNAYMIRRLTL